MATPGQIHEMGSAEVINALVSRSFEENLAFIQQDSDHECLYHVQIGFIPNMKVLIEVNIEDSCSFILFLGTWENFHEQGIRSEFI